MTIRAIRVVTSLLVSVTLLAGMATTPALTLAAKKDKADKKPAGPALAIETIKGAKYRMADAKVADRVTRIADAKADQLTSTGEPAIGAPAYSDLLDVYVADTEMPTKLLSKMGRSYPEGTAGTFYGADASWTARKPAIFVAAKMAARRPGGGLGQQLQVGVDGSDAAPMEAGAADDDVAGLSTFTLSGIFNNGAWSSGATDVSDHIPGDAIDWYNAGSGAFGFYDERRSTWYAVLPRPKDVRRISVAVRSSTDKGEVMDRLELPGGGTFVDLADPGRGLDAKAGLEPLSCRALETFSGSSSDPAPSDPEATLIRYTAGVTPATDEATAAALMGPARDAAGPIPMLLTAVGSEGDPMEVEGSLEVAPGIDAVTLTMEVPAGQWTFAPADGAGLQLPNGEPLIDHATLTGRSGVLTGFGLDGTVAGDPSCGWSEPEAATGAPADQSEGLDEAGAGDVDPAGG